MATDFQNKKSEFSSLAFQIRLDNQDFFRGKTLSKVFIIGKSEKELPILLYINKSVPEDIKSQLDTAFKSVFG
ncbi:hypothetical protein GWA97_01500 [Flavobacterium sp. LaA7.5]|nr:hypothetical protein [Flavobacterium salilacus subsp. altitudinum]